MLATPDLYHPFPPTERVRLPRITSFAGPTFARCVDLPAATEPPEPPPQELAKLRFEPTVPGDRVRIWMDRPGSARARSAGPMIADDIEILFEDALLIVVNKPAGLATQGVAEGTPSVLTRAKSYLKQKYAKPGNVYLGIVSRLDSTVSGALVRALPARAWEAGEHFF